VPAAIVSPEEPVVQRLRGTTKALGWPGTLYGTPFWADSASVVRAGMPSVIYGPGAVHLAHTVDESLEIVEPIRSSQTLAVMTMRFCGLDGTTLISADRCVARGGLS
jgi:acetylornithine deacetylase